MYGIAQFGHWRRVIIRPFTLVTRVQSHRGTPSFFPWGHLTACMVGAKKSDGPSWRQVHEYPLIHLFDSRRSGWQVQRASRQGSAGKSLRGQKIVFYRQSRRSEISRPRAFSRKLHWRATCTIRFGERALAGANQRRLPAQAKMGKLA